MKTDFVEFTVEYKLPDGTTATEFEARARADVSLGSPAYTPRGEYAPTDPPTGAVVEDFSDIQVWVWVRPKTSQERELTPESGSWICEWRTPDAALLAQVFRHLESGGDNDRFVDNAMDQLVDDYDFLRQREGVYA